MVDTKRRPVRPKLTSDVRTPAEFGEVHVDFAHNIPLDRLDTQAVKAVAGGMSALASRDDLVERISEIPLGKPVAVHCEGGYKAWLAAKLPA
jgi:rhodanese-related sulfurtransferase